MAPGAAGTQGNVQLHTLFLPPSGQAHGGFSSTSATGVSCQLLGNVWVRAFPAAQPAHFSLLQAASSLTAALEDFVTPEHLDGENCFKCSK